MSPRHDLAPTGIPGLDQILGDGLLRSRIHLVGGGMETDRATLGPQSTRECMRRDGASSAMLPYDDTGDGSSGHASQCVAASARLGARQLGAQQLGAQQLGAQGLAVGSGGGAVGGEGEHGHRFRIFEREGAPEDVVSAAPDAA